MQIFRRRREQPKQPKRSPLDERMHGALARGDAVEVAALLEQHPALARTWMDDAARGSGPLHAAILLAYESGDVHEDAVVAVVDTLIARGAEPAARDRFDSTPLHAAAWSGYAAVARRLLDHGADANGRDRSGDTPLGNAASRGHAAVVKALIEGGALANAEDGAALWSAASNGYPEVVALLLAHGADPNTRIPNGMSALDVATRRRHAEIVTLLRRYGAREA